MKAPLRKLYATISATGAMTGVPSEKIQRRTRILSFGATCRRDGPHTPTPTPHSFSTPACPMQYCHYEFRNTLKTYRTGFPTQTNPVMFSGDVTDFLYHRNQKKSSSFSPYMGSPAGYDSCLAPDCDINILSTRLKKNQTFNLIIDF